jgi:hypothetical protein
VKTSKDLARILSSFIILGKLYMPLLNYHLIVNVPSKLLIVSMSLPKLLNNVNVYPMTKIPFIKL